MTAFFTFGKLNASGLKNFLTSSMDLKGRAPFQQTVRVLSSGASFNLLVLIFFFILTQEGKKVNKSDQLCPTSK